MTYYTYMQLVYTGTCTLQIIQKFSLSYEGEEILPVLNTVMTPDRRVNIRFTPRH